MNSMANSLIKLIIVLIWIVTSVGLGVLAAYGNAFVNINNIAADYFQSNREKKMLPNDHYLTPVEYLSLYNSKYEHPAPIDTVLDAIISEPCWADVSYDNSTYTYYSGISLNSNYVALFDKIRNTLISYSNLKDIELDRKKISITVPVALKYEATIKTNVLLPQQAINWIKEQKIINSKAAKRYEMFDKILLLMSLGAFGSVIYIIRCLNTKGNDTPISLYVLQPFLGAFLAIAVYITIGIAHTAISTSDISQMRQELLYVASFGAGLISEQTYSIIISRLKIILSKIGG